MYFEIVRWYTEQAYVPTCESIPNVYSLDASNAYAYIVALEPVQLVSKSYQSYIN